MSKKLLPRFLAVTLVWSMLFSSTAAALPTSAVNQESNTTICVSTNEALRTISPRLFGAIPRWYELLEGGIREDGTFWPEYLELLKTMGFTEIRYGDASPLSQSFIWKDTIGPVEDRPATWVRSNAKGEKCVFGMDEFGQLLEEIDATGTMVYCYERGSAKDAAQLVAYLTMKANSTPLDQLDPDKDYQYWANLRAANGHVEPYPIVTIDIGNELTATSCWFGGTLVERGKEWTSENSSRLGTTVPNQGAGLYCFGGTVRFEDQLTIGYPDLDASGYTSSGKPNQKFYASYAPIRLDADNPVEVHIRTVEDAKAEAETWIRVDSFDGCGPEDKVFVLDSTQTGKILFGDGVTGAIPTEGSFIYLAYTSGHHDGFVDYYREIKKVNPDIQVDLEFSVGMALNDQVIDSISQTAVQAMGNKYPYDHVDHHPLMTGWPSKVGNVDEFLRQMMLSPKYQMEYELKLLERIREISGRTNPDDVPLAIKAYGHGQGSKPTATTDNSYTDFHQGLMDGMLRASEILAWINAGFEDADLFLLNDKPYTGNFGIIGVPPRMNAAIINGEKAGSFIAAPIGLSYQLTSPLAGKTQVKTDVLNMPQIDCAEGAIADKLDQLAVVSAVDEKGDLELVVVNQSAELGCTARIDLQGYRHSATAGVSELNGPSATAKNTAGNPNQCAVTQKDVTVGEGNFTYTFPAHSVTRITLTKANKPEQPSASDASATTYMVKAGDSLWKIARKYYGSGSKWTLIFEANRDKINNPNSIRVGQVLIIPAL